MTLIGLVGAALAGLLLLAVAAFFPRPQRGPDLPLRGSATQGGVAFSLMGGGGALGFYLHHRRRWRVIQDSLNAQAAGYATVSLAPRTDQKAVDPSRIDLWQRFAAYADRPDELPSLHLILGWIGTQDRVYALMATPPELRHALGVQINTDFPGADIVEMAPAPDRVPFGDEDEVMVAPQHHLTQGAVHWQDLILCGDDTLPVLSADGLKRSNLLISLLSLLDGVPGSEVWGVQFLVRRAASEKASAILQSVEQRQLEARVKGGKRSVPITSVERQSLQARENKGGQALFEVILRTWAVAPSPEKAWMAADQLSRLLMAHLRPARGSGLEVVREGQDGGTVARYRWPYDGPLGVWGHRELAGLFHLPGQDAAAVSGKLVTARARKLPPAPAARRPAGQSRKELLVVGSYRYPSGEAVEVGIPWEDTKVHIFVVGPTGSGKSTTLGNTVLQYVERGATGVLLEPHGDLVKDIATALPPELAARTIYVDPLSWAPPAMNICAVGTTGEELSVRVDRTMEILRAASGEDWSKMVRLEELLRNGLTILQSVLAQNASLVELRRLLTDEVWRYELLDQAGLDAQEAVTFWRDQFPEWSGQGDALAPVMRRLSPLLNNGVMRPILGLPGSTLDIGGLLDQGMLVLMPLMAGVLQEKNKNVLGTLVVQQIVSAVLARAAMNKEARGLCGIFIDEFPDFVGSTGEAVSILLAQARKFGASVVLAAQSLSQLAANARVLTEVETNCRNKIVYASDARDARRAVELLGANRLLSPDDMVAVGKYRGYVRPTVDRSPVSPAYVRFLPPVESVKQPQTAHSPTLLSLPPHPGKAATELAFRAYRAYKTCAARGKAQDGRHKVGEFLADLSDDDWALYRSGREFLFAALFNRLLQQPMPRDARAKVARMKELSALRIGIPVYERDAEYRRLLAGADDADAGWGSDW